MKLLVEDYRPSTIAECILPDRIRGIFDQVVEKGDFTNMILEGSPGTGKTTAAIAMCKEMDVDYLIINGSKDAGIDVLRTTITQFASTMSLTRGKKKKVVIIDEADYLTNTVQAAMRGMIEDFSKNCRFIFTCNYANRLMEAIHSRCTTVSFTFTEKEADDMMKRFAVRVFAILDKEEVKYDAKSVAMFTKKLYPDMRKILNEIQSYAMMGNGIDSGILASSILGSRVLELMTALKEKNWKAMRDWTADNSDVINGTIFTVLAKHFDKVLKPSSLPDSTILLNEAQAKHVIVPDKELNFLAFMTELMMTVETL